MNIGHLRRPARRPATLSLAAVGVLTLGALAAVAAPGISGAATHYRQTSLERTARNDFSSETASTGALIHPFVRFTTHVPDEK